MSSFSNSVVKKVPDHFLQIFKPNKLKISITVILFAVSIQLTGGWEMIISNIINPSSQGLSAGFPFDAVTKTAGFCPSSLPSSEPVDCVRPSVELNPFGLLADLFLMYTSAIAMTRIWERCSEWL